MNNKMIVKWSITNLNRRQNFHLFPYVRVIDCCVIINNDITMRIPTALSFVSLLFHARQSSFREILRLSLQTAMNCAIAANLKLRSSEALVFLILQFMSYKSIRD